MAQTAIFTYREPAPLSEPYNEVELSGVRSSKGVPLPRGSGEETPALVIEGTNCEYLTENTQTSTGRQTKAIWLWRYSTNTYGIIGE